LLILSRRFKRASEPARRMLAPVEAVAAALTLLVAGFLITSAAGATASGLSTAAVAMFAAAPAAIFGGLYLERAYLRGALARLLERLPRARPENVEMVLTESVKDPSLRLAYRVRSGWIDVGGCPIDIERAAQDRAVAVINCTGLPAAAVLFDRELGDQAHFITAAGEAALMALDRNEMQERLDVEARELAAARRQALEAAVLERRRIMRDLHDGAQQRLIGIQMKLGLAQRRLSVDPGEVEGLMVELRSDLDAAIQNMRALASSAYPPVLADHGLARALARVRDDCPDAITLRLGQLPRYSPGVEAAVYFTCVEALQNVAKHAHSDAPPAVHVREDGGALRFDVADHGAGFELQAADLGTGILSMRERIEAVGGALTVVSAPGHGTVVSGSVPVGRPGRERTATAAAFGGRSDDTRR